MANTFQLIASSTVGSGGAASIDFTSIASTWTDLVLKVSVRSTYAARSNSILITLNSSTSSFTSKIIEGSGSTAYSFSSARNIGAVPASTSTSNTFNNLEIYIPNYAGSNYKSFSSDSVQEDNQTEAYADLTANLWSSSSAITAIGLANSAGNFVQYSTAYLYGVKSS